MSRVRVRVHPQLVTNLVEFVEKSARPGVLGALGRAAERRFTRDLAGYFTYLGKKVADAKLEECETAAAAGIKLDHLLGLLTPVLRKIIEQNLSEGMLIADRQNPLRKRSDIKKQNDKTRGRLQEADKPKQPVNPFEGLDQVGLSAQDAAAYAADKAGELVTGLNATTKQLLQDAVASGIEEQLGVPGLGRLIRDTVAEMSRSRAEMIASTEMNDAMSEAALRKMGRLGIEYKQIILSPDACPICEDNSDADPLPIDEDYPSGDDRPPFHPNCRCALVGARGPDDEE